MAEATPANPTVLIVDDDPATSEFCVDCLSFYGYTTMVAVSGDETLTHLRQQPVDLVLLDRRLPDMDGLEVARRIRAGINARVPIIMLTADYRADLPAVARMAGIDAFLAKPFDIEDLLQQVNDLIRR